MIIVNIVGVRYSVFLFSLISRKRYRTISISTQTHLKTAFKKKTALEGAFELLSFKNSIDKKNMEQSQTERIKYAVNK